MGIQVSDGGGLEQGCGEEGREKAQNQRECFFLMFPPPPKFSKCSDLRGTAGWIFTHALHLCESRPPRLGRRTGRTGRSWGGAGPLRYQVDGGS